MGTWIYRALARLQIKRQVRSIVVLLVSRQDFVAWLQIQATGSHVGGSGGIGEVDDGKRVYIQVISQAGAGFLQQSGGLPAKKLNWLAL
jgi:hypothetical protein